MISIFYINNNIVIIYSTKLDSRYIRYANFKKVYSILLFVLSFKSVSYSLNICYGRDCLKFVIFNYLLN